MEKPDTSPLRTESGAIIVDEAQRKLDAARALYRKRYNQGYSLSEQGHSVRAQRLLDTANAELRSAEEQYAETRKASIKNGVLELGERQDAADIERYGHRAAWR